MPEGGGGPLAPPGLYKARLTVGASVTTLPFHVVEDPRVRHDGVTTATLKTLFNHNVSVRNLVSEVNRTVARVRQAQARLRGATGPAADTLAKVNEIAAQLITPSIRYSQPALQTHVTYLYSMTNQADQPLPKDAASRYVTLKKQLDAIQQALTKLLGPAM